MTYVHCIILLSKCCLSINLIRKLWPSKKVKVAFLPHHSGESLFPNICGLPLLLFFWLKRAGYLAVVECDHAHSFTHQKGLSYQIFELEDSGLPQQGVLPISARKTIIMANHRCLEKDSPHCEP